jgi:hypothetical protein
MYPFVKFGSRSNRGEDRRREDQRREVHRPHDCDNTTRSPAVTDLRVSGKRSQNHSTHTDSSTKRANTSVDDDSIRVRSSQYGSSTSRDTAAPGAGWRGHVPLNNPKPYSKSRFGQDQYDREWPWLKTGVPSHILDEGGYPIENDDLTSVAELDSGDHVMDVGSLDAGYVDKNKEAAEMYAKEQSQPKVPVFNVADFIANAAKNTETSKPLVEASLPTDVITDSLLSRELASSKMYRQHSVEIANQLVNVSVDSLYWKLLTTDLGLLLSEQQAEPGHDGVRDQRRMNFDNEEQYIDKFEPLLLAEVTEAMKDALTSQRTGNKSNKTQRNRNTEKEPVNLRFVAVGGRTSPDVVSREDVIRSHRAKNKLSEIKCAIGDDAAADSSSRGRSNIVGELQKDDIVVLVKSLPESCKFPCTYCPRTPLTCILWVRSA